MNILIPDSWLREYLVTKATPQKIAECLSLCGPSVERVERVDRDWIYDIEVTTNRVDMMSVMGIAREAAAILPQFGIKANLKPLRSQKITDKKNLGLTIKNDSKLCARILALKLEGAKLGPSPKFVAERLKAVGQRPLNNVIDVTNYVMWEVGHPIHVFDFDKIKKIIVREAKKGEKLITLDNKEHVLTGGEVVFSDGNAIVDLPGIMGTKNTVVNGKTKNLLLWIEAVDPAKIRQASMGLAIRSQAAVLNEKSVDPQLGLTAILKAAELMEKTTAAKVSSRLIDIYPAGYKAKTVKTTLQFIEDRLGIKIEKAKISNILQSLEFEPTWSGNNLIVSIPSFRAKDVEIAEDIVEEVARIYGYHNLPNKLMEGAIPDPLADTPFGFELRLKTLLKGFGGAEVYTLSMVPTAWAAKDALALKNPLGVDTAVMRTSLMPSLVEAVDQNKGEKDSFHLFEMANVYLPHRSETKAGLPAEIMTLAGIFAKTDYRKAKGVVEALLEELGINYKFEIEEKANFVAGKRTVLVAKSAAIGEFGVLESNYIYYELFVENLRKVAKQTPTYQPLPKYPAQIEDLTFKLPQKTRVGEVIEQISKIKDQISNVELIDTYKDYFTFRIWYQSKTKTLTDAEVTKIRSRIIAAVAKKFGGVVKD
ncbi:phenylalanine--tRNA ligase subunit beta [Candidatus Woesebacteria bacterium RIFCSPHIGHO2_01_FULL_44_10]|uniref:Phenylalanine--tRNA ligase beta subunit n=1 Tax=Candidatus Woesebacteria bacterium RIFCSPLOWO2_01_FULL_44_14 TaxID=1802525 RepID=A0A1F8BY46_9BACT|nr:MAG: phenylalanine--tRNA ligase subunit beta [Candidatus Woesebacteria bacterium RIFCSPHIGHO2_01_FULL_44_10]OGM56420.1 MAG: phenylalanine--tRNA ligase subunit beta [Candidatus Woesebacteria bacterium RIFCSPHIGHO2_12_FULL_44_11]OGM68820.1 MAG: phenylalanine--tRNA ligase subunit beta [Candidatus Woesebacteria bacterium RIFCSPLOWO2_01_FULL_44_14]